MSEELDQLEDWIAGLLTNIGPAGRLKLARLVAQDLRRQNVTRIAAQRNPDGAVFAPRKRQGSGKGLRSKAGRIKARVAQRAAGPMFRKLRQARYFQTSASAEEASAGFPAGAISRIARVHQEGMLDRVTRAKDSKVVAYPARVLLGFTDTDRRALLDRVLAHLGDG